MKLTLKLKLIHFVDQKEELLQLMRLYNSACNYVSEIAFKEQEFRSYPLHHLTYKKIREDFNLPSQYAISVISTVSDAYKTELTKATKEKRELSQFDILPRLKSVGFLPLLTQRLSASQRLIQKLLFYPFSPQT